MTDPAIRWPRAGGVLLHPTSLPGAFGAGDLGPSADSWVDWLARSACRLWQILPLGPVGEDASPYQSTSAFGGNPLLISPEKLAEDGLLEEDDMAPLMAPAAAEADFDRVRHAKSKLVEIAVRRFLEGAAAGLRAEAAAFFDSSAWWLDDFALFTAIQTDQGGRPWTAWPGGLAGRVEEELDAFRHAHRREIEAEKVRQFFFERQWARLRNRAHSQGIDIIGDVAIFVAHDSADVWAHRQLFKLDAQGQPIVVAGVPPDYFSATGQRWGNPLYDWEAMESDDYAWWIARLRRLESQVDRIRVDHFRGFESAWEIPAKAPTAETGKWVSGPGQAMFHAVEEALGRLPIIAEDLGFITPQVEALRDQLGFPGMRVLQFGFDGNPDHPYLPHRYPANCVAYTGTHDNDTSRGWYESASEAERHTCRTYLSTDGEHIAWDFTRAVWGSEADTAIVPMQDLLDLGSPARMNTPGTTEGNWTWRVLAGQLNTKLADRVRELNRICAR